MRDVQALFWLRWRQFKDTAVYWLRVLGYRPQDASFSQNLYVLYLVLIGLFWVYTVGTWVFETAAGIGKLLAPSTAMELLVGFTWATLVVQVYVMVNALQSTPLKLSFADMAYVAGAPITRVAPVIVGFIRQVGIRLVLLNLPIVVLGVIVGRALLPLDYGGASVRLVLAMIPLIVLTWGVGWIVGLSRLISPRLGRLRYLWFVPLILLPLAYLLPDIFLWQGRIAVLVMLNQAPVWGLPLLFLLAAVAVGITFAMGARINMIHAVDESILYARIQALGLLAWRMIDVQARIRMQARTATRKPFLSLPRAEGNATFVTRAVISYVRHPFMLLACFAWGAVMTYFGIEIIVRQLPAQIWILWVIVAGIAPPFGLLHVFRSDEQELFLRQFLPVDGLQLLMNDIVVPLIVLIVGGLAVWVVYGFDAEVLSLGFVAIPLLGLMVALCGGGGDERARVLQTRLLATGASFGAVIIAGTQFQNPIAGLAVAAVAVLLLSGIVGTNS
ncbi:MAG: hypothetical protein U0521_11880 [Anaerolineae bacterium]